MTPPDERSPHKAGSGSRLGGETSENHTTPDEARERPFVLQWRSAVLNSSLTSTQRLCLLVLAEWADPDGSNCFPALESVAIKAGVNEKTARLALKAIEDQGWFKRQHRRTTSGWKHFQYTLTLPDAADTRPARSIDAPDIAPVAQANAPGTAPVRTDDAAGDMPGTNASEIQCTGLSVQVHRTLRPNAPGTAPDDLSNDLAKEQGEVVLKAPPDDRFPDFWKAYPRKDARKATEILWTKKKLSRHADRIIADVLARVADPGQWTDVKFIPYATTYLNQQRWLDEWKPAGGAGGSGAVGAIERDNRSDEEIQQANEAELARFGLGAAA